MSILVSCDTCGKELRAKDEAAGKQAKCPNCQAIIQIPHADEYADDAVEDADDTRSRAPQDEFGDDRQPCPACGEMIASTARKCRYCDEILDTFGKKKSHRSGRAFRRQEGDYPTADLGKRFLGAFVDGLMGGLFIGPGYGMFIASGIDNPQRRVDESMAMIGLLLLMLGGLTLLAIQCYLLATRSQSIGKWLVNTQIMDYETHQPAGFVKAFWLRGVVNQLICGIPCLGAIYALIDIFAIFSEERRCLHDQIAGTYVVDISQ